MYGVIPEKIALMGDFFYFICISHFFVVTLHRHLFLTLLILVIMKKSIYLALAAVTLALFACNSKPADSEQASEQQESVETIVEEPEAEAEPAEAEEMAEQPVDSLALAEEPAAEEQPAEQPAEEQPAPAPVAEPAPAVPSDKFEIANSDGNYIAFVNEIVTADADRCFEISMVMDKQEETKVKLILQISNVDGSKIGLYPVAIDKGGTKASFRFCPPGGVFDAIKAGEQYKLSFHRATLAR